MVYLSVRIEPLCLLAACHARSYTCMSYIGFVQIFSFYFVSTFVILLRALYFELEQKSDFRIFCFFLVFVFFM